MEETLDYQHSGSGDSTSRSIKDVLINGHNLSMREALKTAWQIYVQGFGLFIGYTIVCGIITFVTLLIPFLGALTYILVIGPALLTGFFIVFDKIYNKESYSFTNFFDGFKGKLGTLVLNTLILIALVLLMMVPIIIMFGSLFANSFSATTNSTNPIDIYTNMFFNLGAGMIGIAIYYFFMLFCFSLLLYNYQLLLFKNTGPMESIVMSARITIIQYWKYLVAYIALVIIMIPLSYVFAQFGAIGTFIQMIFLIIIFSFELAICYAFYALIFKKDEALI